MYKSSDKKKAINHIEEYYRLYTKRYKDKIVKYLDYTKAYIVKKLLAQSQSVSVEAYGAFVLVNNLKDLAYNALSIRNKKLKGEAIYNIGVEIDKKIEALKYAEGYAYGSLLDDIRVARAILLDYKLRISFGLHLPEE